MKIVVGCDHGGFPLKHRLLQELRGRGTTVVDVGTFSEVPVDYPDIAVALARVLRSGRAQRGILICGSGVGASIAANKIQGIRAGLCHDTFSARQGVEDDDANVLCLGARVIGPELALECVRAFLAATFSRAARHRRRVGKVNTLDRR
jgi:ribose 5-phosphate isomerase B